MNNNWMPRRQFLWRAGGGLGGIALAEMLARDGLLAGTDGALARGADRAALNGGLHHPAKARRVVQLFMNGGVSQMDTFDYKPELHRRDGKPFDPGAHFEAPTSAPGNLMKSPFPFRQYGECGRWVSSVFPELAGCVDGLAFLMAVSSKTNVHGPASYMMNTGFLMPGFPSMGAWLSYGLGSLSDNLPCFVVLPDPKGLPYNAKGNFTSGFLPQSHQGTILEAGAARPIPELFPPAGASFITKDSGRDGRDVLASLNRLHAAANPGDSRLESRIEAYELAARMQQSAPEALDLASETPATQRMYGLHEGHSADFGRRCLLARRLIERGVRFVQVWSGRGDRRTTGTTTRTSTMSCRRLREPWTGRSPGCCVIWKRGDSWTTRLLSSARSSGGSRLLRGRRDATIMGGLPSHGWPGRASRRVCLMGRVTRGDGGRRAAGLIATTFMLRFFICWGSSIHALRIGIMGLIGG